MVALETVDYIGASDIRYKREHYIPGDVEWYMKIKDGQWKEVRQASVIKELEDAHIQWVATH